MIIETLCEQGIVRLPAALKFQHDTFMVKVDVPDTEVTSGTKDATGQPIQTDLHAQQTRSSLGARIDAILGPYKALLAQGPEFTPRNYKDMWRQHLEEKHLGRR